MLVEIYGCRRFREAAVEYIGQAMPNDVSRLQTDERVFDFHLTKPLWLDDIGDVLLCSENMRPGVCSRMSVQLSLLQHQRCA